MPSINFYVINRLKDDYNKYTTFVETGTYCGETIFEMEPYFTKLYTVELSPTHYNSTRAKYSGSKINFILGDSVNIFEKLLPTINENVIFFLDGHWSSGDTAKGDKDCPLIEEVTHINNLFHQNAIIIIDDCRLFGKNKKDGVNEDWSGINSNAILTILKARTTDVYYIDSSLARDDRLIIHIGPITS
jgi:hypothetical protein